MNDRAYPDGSDRTLVQLRLLLILSTACLILAQHPGALISSGARIFIAFYLASNLAFAVLVRSGRPSDFSTKAIVTIDASVLWAVLLGTAGIGDVPILFFVVILMVTQPARLVAKAGAAVLISLVHLYTKVSSLEAAVSLQSSELMIAPFLLIVALFFGQLVESGRADAAVAESLSQVGDGEVFA